MAECSMDCFLGIDGGGTRTAAWLADSAGKLLARAESGPSNPFKVGLRAAEREILKAFRTAWREAGFPPSVARTSRPPVVRGVCAGISGVDRRSVHRPLLAWMRRHIPARHYLLTSDAVITLAAAVRNAPGIIVIAGTGSIAFARDEQERLLRAGGWGLPFDDRGSGYELGRQAVGTALEAFDGRGPHTILMDRICQHLHLGEITEIVSRQLEPQQIAALFPLVMEAAREGDLVSRHLCDDAARDLANLAAALLKRAGWTERSMPVVTTGGVFKSSILIRRAFTRHLRRFAPQARVELLERPPVEGALWLARGLGGKKSRGNPV
ncbi:MAG TPA: BadF/BadG/BcrA/BcrD ATPase family protein [Terriglobia bacterium]|nr:BadF/BadG/BcrA/BcrD ATPase family protein [Terriglobia bacterium]